MLSRRRHWSPATRVLAGALGAAVVAWLAVTLLVVSDDEQGEGGVAVTPAAEQSQRPRVEFRADGKYVDGRRQKDPEEEAGPAADAGPAPEAPQERVDTPPRRSRGAVALAIGQKIMTRMAGTAPSRDLLRRVRAGQVGGVILFGDNIRSLPQVRAAIGQLQEAAAAGGNPPLLVAVDQEGGDVKRFASLPPTAAPAQMTTAAAARQQGARTGAALAGLGVTVDLAPVADVPVSAQSFLGTRAFGRSPARVAELSCAFARGLVAGGVFATLKHFPGLGAAGANTDLASVRITTPAATVRQGYAPYRRCARDAGLVMIASAAYPSLTGPGPAVLERATYERELPRAGFDGVTISDDLETPGLDAIPEVAVKATAAGLDVLLYAKTEAASARAFDQMRAAVRDGRLARAQVTRSADQVRSLKESLAP